MTEKMENKMMKLYKFRSLGSCEDLKRAKNIIKTGTFWCSHFWKLNDPMEGVYWFYKDTISDENISKLYEEKHRYAICSFSGRGDGEDPNHEKCQYSGPKGFSNPTMWGYYANGLRGIAIEIEAKIRSKIEKVEYNDTVQNITNNAWNDADVKRILTTKLKCWIHEDEYRYISKHKTGLHKIGKITGVYFGAPYKNVLPNNLTNREMLEEYECRVNSLKKCVEEINDKKRKRKKGEREIKCHDVIVDIKTSKVILKSN